jgi:FAD synthase
MEQEIKLGMKVRDKVSGFEGIAITRVEFLNGCVQIGVKPKINKDGKMEEAHHIDIQQLEVVGTGVNTKPQKTGGGFDRLVPKNV